MIHLRTLTRTAERTGAARAIGTAVRAATATAVSCAAPRIGSIRRALPPSCISARSAAWFSSASSSNSARPSHKPDAPAHTAAAAAGKSDAPSVSTTADERADAEAGLNQTVQSGEAKRAAAAASHPSSPSATAPPAGSKASSTGSSGGGSGAGSDGDDSSSAPLGPANWASVLFLLFVGGGAVLYYRYKQDALQNTVRIETIGKPLLGGAPFRLTDDAGREVTSESLKGRYVLLYFGFTHCPDVCPTELKRMAESLDVYAKLMGPAPELQVIPVFISIDPRRDTPARLAVYKQSWDPRIRWLTGSDAEVAAIAKNYRVYYSAPEVAPGSDDDYLVDHSIFLYLLDRDGQFMEFFGKSIAPEEVAQRMARLVGAENQKAKK